MNARHEELDRLLIAVVVAGTAWLFLLPASVFGLALLVASLWVLTSRSQTST